MSHFLHALAAANILMVIFNVTGMACGFTPPPIAGILSLWTALVCGAWLFFPTL